MHDHIDRTADGHVTTVTINRPEKRNAITQPMYAALADALEEHAQDASSRVLVITGVGEAFTSGNDLFDFSKGDGSDSPPVVRFLHAIQDCPKPVVAAVNGMAIGVGLTMLLHCDLAVCAASASFSAPFASLALVPEAASSLLLPNAIGMAIANDILMACRTLSADEARQAGLVSRVFDDETFMSETATLAQHLAAMSPTSLVKTKALIRKGRDAVRERMEEEGKEFFAQLSSADFQETVMARMQKRAPVYS